MSEKTTTRAGLTGAETTPANPSTPDLKSDSGRNEPVSGTMVIPVILAIVLAVVVVATFFEDEYRKLPAMLGLSDEVADPEITAYVESSDDTAPSEASDAETQVSDQPGDAATDIAAQIPDQVTEAIPVTAAPDITVENASEDESASSPEAEPVAPSGTTVPYTSNRNPPYYNAYNSSPDYASPYQPYYAYPDYSEPQAMIAEQRRIWEEIEERRRMNREEMMAFRRQLRLEAEAARREHLANMQSIRTAVLRRIEQDRSDMDRQMQEMYEAMNKRRDQADKRMMEFRSRSERTEI